MIRSIRPVTILVPLLLIAIIGCSTPPTPKSEISGTDEWINVKQAVATLMASVDPPITNLSQDERVDWSASASSPGKTTRNMTGERSIDGEIPLLVITDSGSDIKPVSYYLGTDHTQHYYWIDSTGRIHVAE